MNKELEAGHARWKTEREQSGKHSAGERIVFSNESNRTVQFRGRKYFPGNTVQICLTRDWNEDEGIGEGGPWGWGGYTTALLRSITKP